MRSIDAATLQALYDAPTKGLVPRQFVYVYARDPDTDAITPFGFHGDIGDLTVNVISGETGLEEARAYSGNGALREISDIKLTTGLSVETVSVTLSHIHEQVRTMMYGYKTRNCGIEIHRGLLSTKSRRMVYAPYLHWKGKISTPDMPRGAVESSGSISLDCVGFKMELTKFNPAKSGHAHQSTRGADDHFMQYADVMTNFIVPWGEAS